MKILYCHNANFDANSANKLQVLHMVGAFTENKISIRLVGFGKPSKTHVFLKPGSNYYFRSLKLAEYALQQTEKHVYTRDLLCAYIVKTFAPKKKVIYELHHMVKNPLWTILLNRTLKKIDHCVVISNGLKKEITHITKKITVLHDGVKPEIFTKAKPRLKGNYVMCASNFNEWKGVETLFKAAQNINAKVVVLGGTVRDVSKYAKQYPAVDFRGRVPYEQLPGYLKSAKVLVLPTSAKFAIGAKYTSPLKLFDYMACGKKIVASDVPSAHDILPKNTAYFFTADDSKSLAHTVNIALKDKTTQKEKAVLKLVKEFTWKKRAQKIIQIFTQSTSK